MSLNHLLLATILATIFLLSNTSALPSPDLTRRTAPPSLLERDVPICKHNGCTCHPEFPLGKYCGACGAVKSFAGPVECSSLGCFVFGVSVFDTLYECGPGGSCCTYGYSQECHDTGYPC